MMRPILFASVPNHIAFVGAWKCMCRMLPLTGYVVNFSVFGSNMTSCFTAPVSENHSRPWSSRSEERRVGKEGMSGWSRGQYREDGRMHEGGRVYEKSG